MDSDSESEFDGFDLNDVDEANERLIAKNNELDEVYNESDIDLSDLSDDEGDELSEGSDHNSSDGENGDDDNDPYLNQLRAEWTRQTSEIILPDFTESAGVSHGLPANSDQLQYFLRFLPQQFFENVAMETNRYAEQRGVGPRWQPTTAAEVRAFISVNIMTGVRQLPRLSNYWSTDCRFSDPYISSIMTKTRFMHLNKFIHLRDTSNVPDRNHPNYDPLFKVRSMIDTIIPNLEQNYKPGQNLSVDEGMIGFKGRVHFRQYMPAKPTKWGIKVWQICDAESAYCCKFEIYTGKKQGGRQHGLGYDVVWSLSVGYHDQNRHLYFDRFFSSVTLAEHLELVNTYVCGTIMANRKGLPDVVKKAKLKRQGDIIQSQKGNLLATSFKDKRQITFLSTCAQPGMDENVNKPNVNVMYNSYMGGVDKFDQLASYYPVGRAGNKWWRYVMWYIVNMAIVNAWIMFQQTPNKDPPPSKYYDHLQFRVDVADQLRAGFTSRKHKAGRRSKQDENRVVLGVIDHHKLVKIEGRKRVCRECTKHGRKTPKGRSVETSFMCRFCGIPLCRVGCFGNYHDRNVAN